MAVIVVLVDRPGVDEVLEFNRRKDVAEFGVEADLELVAAGRNHPLEHGCVTLLRNGLEILPQVAVVAIGANGDASADGCIKILGVAPPLLECVSFEKFFVELPSDLANDNFFGVRWIFHGDAVLGDPRLHFLRGGCTPEELLEGVEINRKIPITPVAVRQDLVIDRMPLGKLTEIINDARGVGAEVVGSVGVDKDAGLVVFVVGVAAKMVALLDNETRLPLLRGETLCNCKARKSGSNNEAVDVFSHVLLEYVP